MIPAVLGRPAATGGGRRRRALARVVAPDKPSDALVVAVRRALVLLADHELATSTLAVRIAGSVRTDPYAAIAAGLAVVSGTAARRGRRRPSALLVDCSELGAADAVAPTARRRRAAARIRPHDLSQRGPAVRRAARGGPRHSPTRTGAST